MSDNNPITDDSFTQLPEENSDQSSTAPGQTNLSGANQKGKSAGTPVAKVATQQIQISHEDIEKFDISEEFAKSNPVLVDLILKTESMKDEERKYWFQLLPIMSEEQLKKLQGILQNERDQLSELDAKYEAEIAKLNDGKVPQISSDEARKRREMIQKREKEHQQKEASQEQNILDQLDNL